MSHKPAPEGALEQLNGRLSDSARATLIRIARKIAEGFDGEIKILVNKGGGIRFVEWVQREDGATIKEELG